MFHNNLKVAFCTFLIGVFFAISAVAFAATSPWKNYGPVYGYSYRNQSECNAYIDGAGAHLYAETTASNAPAGYIGAYAILGDANGNAIYSSGWDYSIETCKGIYASTIPRNLGGYYCGKGMSKAYNGDGYNTYNANQTVMIKY